MKDIYGKMLYIYLCAAYPFVQAWEGCGEHPFAIMLPSRYLS
jgi:hypothetical protein